MMRSASVRILIFCLQSDRQLRLPVTRSNHQEQPA